MSQAALHILMSLAEGRRHGYAVKQEIEERTGGALVLGPGTLYEAIHRMLKEGWVEETAAPREEDGGGARRYYRLTAGGRRAMEAELQRLDALVRHARSRGLVPKPRGA
jgi:DNA-binding PadR family transcriptional regulator